MIVKKLLLIFTVCILGCSTVVKESALLQKTTKPETIQIQNNIAISLDTGVERHIRADSKWMYVGDINNGKVYRPVDDVFSIEGTQRYEAYLVVASGKVVGFYLPASSHYSPLAQQVSFP